MTAIRSAFYFSLQTIHKNYMDTNKESLRYQITGSKEGKEIQENYIVETGQK